MKFSQIYSCFLLLCIVVQTHTCSERPALQRRSQSVPNLRHRHQKHEEVLASYSRYPQMLHDRVEKIKPKFMLKIDAPPVSPPTEVCSMNVVVTKRTTPKHTKVQEPINFSRPFLRPPPLKPKTHRHLIDESVTEYILQDYIQPDELELTTNTQDQQSNKK